MSALFAYAALHVGTHALRVVIAVPAHLIALLLGRASVTRLLNCKDMACEERKYHEERE